MNAETLFSKLHDVVPVEKKHMFSIRLFQFYDGRFGCEASSGGGGSICLGETLEEAIQRMADRFTKDGTIQ
jgi:hypothetical protein